MLRENKPQKRKRTLIKTIWRYRWNYIFILPGIILLFLFSYKPMVGLLAAFKDYEIGFGLWKSEWIGLKNFAFLKDPYYWRSFKNTVFIAAMKVGVTFPMQIVFALMINELQNGKYKKIVQSVSYIPHFMSWIVVAYLIHILLALDTGVVNNVLSFLGLDQIHFMGREDLFRPIVTFSNLWKTMGWGAIIYIAALSGIDPQLHEAAKIDGAGRLARIYHINLPGILPTIAVVAILTVPSLLSAGFDQIMPLTNSANTAVSEVLDVYIVRLGLSQAKYSVTTAMGLIVSVLNLILVVVTNYISKKTSESSLW